MSEGVALRFIFLFSGEVCSVISVSFSTCVLFVGEKVSLVLFFAEVCSVISVFFRSCILFVGAKGVSR